MALLVSFYHCLHYADKATSYIFTAEASIFLALLFIIEALRRSWKSENSKNRFQIAVVVTLALILVTVGVYVLGRTPAPMQTGEATHLINSKLPLTASAGVMAISAIAAIVFLVQGLGWEQIRSSRTFDLIVLPLILILPLLIALPLSILGFDATDYSQNGIIRSGIAFSLLGLASLGLGMLWTENIPAQCGHFLGNFHRLLHHVFQPRRRLLQGHRRRAWLLDAAASR